VPINLKAPLPRNPDADTKTLLDMLQGNVLSGHGRHVTAHVFLRFDPSQRAAARAFLSQLGARLTSAAAQHAAADRFRAAKKAGRAAPATPTFLACVLSKTGYAALGVPAGATPADAAFRGGLKARGPALGDSASGRWDETYQGEVHAMILVAGDPERGNPARSKGVEAELASLRAALPASAVKILGSERGRAYFNANHDGIEHFGYVDGRSQPLLREVDVAREIPAGDPVRWDPAFPLEQVLVRDPGASDARAFGSYFVYRKLEQNVRRFHAAEDALQAQLEALDADFPPELAGAQLIGRFEDGTPVVLRHAEGMHHPVPNNFDFDHDKDGLRCPFHAHIRKANPRGQTTELGATVAQERAHIMARRGITYGARRQNRKKEFVDKPTGKVGLLFMAYQADIANQFEFTQASWANDARFLHDGTGIDPIIGQAPAGAQTHRAGWGDDDKTKVVHKRLADFVTLKGGEYFFAPSLPFFAAL